MRRTGFCAGALFVLGLVVPLAQAAERLTGRPVAQVLDEAIRSGARIIYSSERVPPNLRVLREPEAEELFVRLHQVLAPHGLMLQATAGDVWVVVRTQN